jgi:dipeptidyl aminopeptidase/acylaminoacyl peptidase
MTTTLRVKSGDHREMDSFRQKQENSQDASLMPRLLPLFLAAFYLSVATSARCAETAGAPSLIAATDLFNLKQVEAPALSPDGRWVAYVVRSIEPKPDAKDDWAYRTQLWLAAVDGTIPPRQLTFGTAGNTSPAWSPQGDRIAFVRTVEKGKPQIHLLSLAGGEAMPLTKLETGAANPRWSPDGTRILFTSSLSYTQLRGALEKAHKEAAPAWGTEKPGRKPNDTANWGLNKKGEKIDPPAGVQANPDGSLQEMREWLAKEEAEGNPRVIDRLNFLAEGDLAPEPEFSQLYVIEPREGAEPAAINLGYTAYTNAAWMTDGQSIVCTGRRKTDEHPDRSRFRSLYVIDVASGRAKALLEEAGINYDDATPSPDGKWIACTMRTGGEFSFEQPMVAVVPAGGGGVKLLTQQLDRAAASLQWSANSAAIYFTAPSHGHFPVYRVGVADAKVATITAQNEWGIDEFAVGAKALVEVVTHPGNPWELYRSSLDGRTVQPLTTLNSSWLKDRRLSAYEPHALVNAEGLTIDYWTLKPAAFDPAKKYPLLVNIHGGPTAMWGPGEASTWLEMQYFAARGYVVVFSNPRGSGGYGRDFQRANFKDWGTGPASDVLAAADFTAKEPYVDRNRQVLTGGSYGGYLTAWIVGHDQRFKAAVAQRGVYDLATFFGEGNAWFLLPLYFGGFPWEKDVRTVLDRDSPLTYVTNIKTPLLIKHGDTDFRTGFVQSQLLYKSLKQLGRPVEYARYPHATHELSRSGEPRQRLDRLVRFEEFFRRYIGEN